MNDEMLQAYVAAFGAQHHELRQLVRALHEVSRESRPWSREAAVDADELLVTLDTHLKHHFAQEEEGGYLEESLNLAPHLFRWTHCDLRDRLRSSIASNPTSTSGTTSNALNTEPHANATVGVPECAASLQVLICLQWPAAGGSFVFRRPP